MDRPSLSDLVRLYDSTALYWDSRIYRGVYQRSYIRLFNRLEAQGWLGQHGRPLRVLDCGIGAGLLTTSLIAAVSRSFDLYGIDTSTKMLGRARSRLLASGVHAIMAIADTCSLPFCVMTALVLEHTLALLDALHEMARVARPKATLLFVTTRSHAPDILFRLRYQPLEKRRLLGWMADAGIRSIWSGPLSGLARPFARAYVGTKLEESTNGPHLRTDSVLRTWRFLTLLLVSLSMGMAFCHALELLPKLDYDASLYLTLQRTLYPLFGAPLGAAIEVGAVLSSIGLIFLAHGHRPSFVLTVAGAACMLVAHVIWWICVNPANGALAHMALCAPA